MILYAYSCNATLAHPIKNRAANKLLQAYQHFYTILHNARLLPHMHKLDNETSSDIEHFIATQNAAVQYVPHGIITTQMQQNKPFKLGKITSSQDLQATPNYSLSHTGAYSLIEQTSFLT